jgi:D-proline reductase (dithiol) PrdB
MTELLELAELERTPELEQRFVDWSSTLIHHDAQDVRNDPVAFTPLKKPLSESRVALVSTGGVHLRTQEPFDTSLPEGDWTFREFPGDTPSSELMISHTHYNHGDADEDVNCMFPIDRLRELVEAGVVGSVGESCFGVMGFIPNGRHVVEETGPAIAARLKEEGTDVVLLTPS